MTIDATERTAAKVAGICFLATFVIVVYANFAIHDRLNVANDAAATAAKIVAHETAFRVGIVMDLLYCAGIVMLIAALYVVLKPVSDHLALLAALMRLMFIISWFVMTFNLFDVLRVLHNSEYLHAIDVPKLQALAKLYLAARFDRYYAGLLFYALAATVGAWLWLKSRYIPRLLAWFGVIGSAWCVFCALTFVIFPTFTHYVNAWLFDTPMALFELVLGGWLVVKGLPREAEAISA